MPSCAAPAASVSTYGPATGSNDQPHSLATGDFLDPRCVIFFVADDHVVRSAGDQFILLGRCASHRNRCRPRIPHNLDGRQSHARRSRGNRNKISRARPCRETPARHRRSDIASTHDAACSGVRLAGYSVNANAGTTACSPRVPYWFMPNAGIVAPRLADPV